VKQYERNLKARELEKTDLDEAIRLYELNVTEHFEGNGPYDRLIIIYKKRKQLVEAIRVAQKAVFVFENIVHKSRGDRLVKLKRFIETLQSLTGSTELNKKHEEVATELEVERQKWEEWRIKWLEERGQMPDARKKGNKLLLFLEEYVVVDIETTGLSAEHDEIIEIGAIKVISGEIADKFHTMVKPTKRIGKSATNVNGITNEMVEYAPHIMDVIQDFYNFVKGFVIVGHCVDFDVNFLYDALLKHKQIHLNNNLVDTIQFSRRFFKDFKNHKLVTLASNFGIVYSTLHRATDDCIVTHKCYEYMKNYVKTNLDIKKFLPGKSFTACKNVG